MNTFITLIFFLFTLINPKLISAAATPTPTPTPACKNVGQPCTPRDLICDAVSTECAADSVIRPRTLPTDNVTCNLTAPAFSGGNFILCVNGFASRESARNYTSITYCERKASFAGNTTFCGAGDGPWTVDFGEFADDWYAFNPLTGWYTCFGVAGVDPNVRALGTNIIDQRDGSQICRVDAWFGKETQACDANGLCDTALGTISNKIDGVKNFLSDFLRILIGISGGLALCLLVYAMFILTTSAGDQKKISSGKDIIEGVVAGLLFMIFSVILLKIIGINILALPGLQ
jgi:hypothetical protein